MPKRNQSSSNVNNTSTRSKSKSKKAKETESQSTNDDMSTGHNSNSSEGTPERGNKTSYSNNMERTTTMNKSTRPTNYQSLRRQCNRSKTRATNNTTQENINKIDTKYTSRVTLKLSLPPSTNPLNTILQTLQEFIEKLTEINQGDIGLIAWKQQDVNQHDALTEPEHIPPTLSKLLIYSPRIFPGKINKPNTVYAKLNIAHEELFTDIQTELDYWLRSNSHGLYYNMLQEESVISIGWLLYSLRSMDAGALAEELFDSHGIEVGLRWQVIDQGLKGKIPAEQRISALHIEASTDKKSTTIKALLSLYGRSKKDETDTPNGIKFRFVTLRSTATNRTSITKLDRLRVRQKKFITKICQNSSWDIVHLDRIIREDTCSLRSYIMNLFSSEYKDIALFHSVDLDYNGDGFIFTYLPELKAEAETAIQTLFPLIRHKNNTSQTLLPQESETTTTASNNQWQPLTEDELKSFFTQEAIDRTDDMYYDNSKLCIVDPLIDNNLELVIDDDTFEKLLGPDTETNLTETTKNIPGRPAPRVLHSSLMPEGDADSISTFGGSLSSRRTNFRNGRNARPPASDDSTMSSNTTVTNDEFNSLNNQVQSLTSQLALSQMQNNEILQLLRNPPSTSRAGQPSSAETDAGTTLSDTSDGLE